MSGFGTTHESLNIKHWCFVTVLPQHVRKMRDIHNLCLAFSSYSESNWTQYQWYHSTHLTSTVTSELTPNISTHRKQPFFLTYVVHFHTFKFERIEYSAITIYSWKAWTLLHMTMDRGEMGFTLLCIYISVSHGLINLLIISLQYIYHSPVITSISPVSLGRFTNSRLLSSRQILRRLRNASGSFGDLSSGSWALV